jgi:RNA polymerase sigma-70 factor (ECF subfamily)
LSTDQIFCNQISHHLPALRRYARTLRRRPDQAEDLEQDCIERALSRSHLFEAGTNLRAWLFTIMHNIAVTQSRREASQQRSALYYGPHGPSTVGARQDVVVELNEIIALSKVLTSFERRVLQHMCVDDLGYGETARRVGKPVGTIKSRLSRARQRMRDAVASPRFDGGVVGAHAGRSAIGHDGAEMQAAG